MVFYFSLVCQNPLDTRRLVCRIVDGLVFCFDKFVELETLTLYRFRQICRRSSFLDVQYVELSKRLKTCVFGFRQMFSTNSLMAIYVKLDKIDEVFMTEYSVSEKDINDLLDSAEYQEFQLWGKDFILCARLKNGWTMVGRAACVDPDNFDPEIGRKLARQDLVNQLWPLLGYQMQVKMDMAKTQQ